MPELVAILHYVGLAAVLVGFNSYLRHETGMEQKILVNIRSDRGCSSGYFIAALPVTFTGSEAFDDLLRGR